MSRRIVNEESKRLYAFFEFIKERYSIHVLKDVERRPKPWTADPILQHYRFCNVHREDDKVTRWIAKHWRTPHRKDCDLWFAMCVARFINWPETLADIGWPVPYNAYGVNCVLTQRKNAGQQVWTGAYIVSTNGNKCDKADYVLDAVLQPMWVDRMLLREILTDARCTLAYAHSRLSNYNGMGSFMAAQVVADLKYTQPLSSAPDWHTWAASGPGSRRGLQYLLHGGSVERNAPWNEQHWLQELQALKQKIDGLLCYEKLIPAIHAQDLQNCLCEYSKYVRVQQGIGRPRSTYDGV